MSVSANALRECVLSCNPYSSQPHTLVVDVAQSLDDIQAPRDAVKSTAIALVRVDSAFLPGTTIGATHWVAYAMTKGASLRQAYWGEAWSSFVFIKVASVLFLARAAIAPFSNFQEFLLPLPQ